MPAQFKPHSIFLILILLFAAFTGFSQNVIKGTIADSTKAPVPFCAVALLNAKDSSLVKGTLADENGNFIFEKTAAGGYLVKVANAGFKASLSQVLQVDSLSQITLDTLFLNSESIHLKEVSVSVFKPTVEFKKGIVVLNVENSILAGGNTVVELLRRIPGVVVDAQNNITVNGRGDVRFLMDGRLQQIPTSQMMTILSGMPAETVASIELIKNPPAKYDAAGSGGLINIVLKKAKIKGISGSVSESISMGAHIRNGTTLSLNFKSNRLSVFTNMSYYALQFETNNYLRNSISDSSSKFETISTGRQLPGRSILNLNGGLEYELDKKTIIGVNVSSSPSSIKNNEISTANITSGNPFAYDQLDFTIATKQKINNPVFNINATRKFDTLGSQLQLSADYTNYLEGFSKYTINNFYNRGQQILSPNRTRTGFDNDFKIYTQKLDYNKEFKNTFSFEAGLKSSFVSNFSKATVELTDPLTNDLAVDTTFSNGYTYNERILAAYVTLSKTIKKLDLKTGLRMEQTNIDASNAPKPFRLHRNYINLFPNASADYKINDKHSLQFNYSYRIDRPNYDQLNPTRVYNEQLHYGSGNPQLKPQYSHYIELAYNYRNFITLTAGYYVTRNFMYYYFYGNPQTKITIDTIFNYRQRNNAMLNLFVQKQVKWLNVQWYSFLSYRTFNGKVNGTQSNSETFQYYSNFNIEIMLPKAFKVQLNGFYNSKLTDGIQVYYPSGSVSVGILRSFFKNKVDVSLSLYDVFYTERYPASNAVNGQSSYYTERTDSRRIRAYVMWKFGKMKIDKKLKEGNEDEKKRLKSVN